MNQIDPEDPRATVRPGNSRPKRRPASGDGGAPPANLAASLRPAAPSLAPAPSPKVKRNAEAVEDPNEQSRKVKAKKRREEKPRSVTMNVNSSRQLGKYELAFELASGGFAVVYLARAKGPGGFEKFVALKRIHSHLANEKEFVEMFLDEARIAACINHPNVCPVFDFGQVDGAYYLAMDYVFGEPLSEVMRGLRKRATPEIKAGRFPYIARMIADAADGLHAAHNALGPDGEPLNVVHRDVAPANLFIRYDGHVQIVDFGIASADKKLHMTAAGVMKGHLAYVSPEQFRGETADRRVDVWSLGVILWEMLAARRLYKRESDIKTMFAVTDEPFHSARIIDPEVPEELDEIARRALTKDKNERYQTARELSAALHSYLRKTDHGVNSHDLGAWVQEVLPGAREKRKQLLDQARVILSAKQPAPLESVERRRLGTVSASSTDMGPPAEAQRAAQQKASKSQSSSQAPGAEDKEWWFNPWFWVALAGVGVLCGALWSLVQ